MNIEKHFEKENFPERNRLQGVEVKLGMIVAIFREKQELTNQEMAHVLSNLLSTYTKPE